MDHHDAVNFNIINKLSMINEGDVLVDVGANVGDYTNFFLKCLNKTGMVYAFEPHPDTYNHYMSIVGNHNNLNSMNVAVSDVDGEIDFYNSVVHQMHNAYNGSYIGKVPSVTLDTVLNVPKISLIKIDVEGAELAVLKGMPNTLAKTNTIFLENHLNHWKELYSILALHNFICFDIETKEQIGMHSKSPYQCLCVRNNDCNLLKNI